MARTSRSSKKQPAFDPSELEDLIFSPAVGSGVGSHLLETPPSALEPDTPTVVMLDEATVDTTPTPDVLAPLDSQDQTTVPDMTTAGDLNLSPVVVTDRPTGDNRSFINKTTVDIPSLATVDAFKTTHHPDRPTVGALLPPTDSELPTVDRFPGPLPVVPERPRRGIVFWITERGDLVPQGRVKRISLAQDVINPAEESVYDTLWTAKSLPGETGESFRIVQAGYDYLGRKTRLSKKTIQRIVAKLIDKDFIAVERPADIYQRTSTVYRVFSYKAVLDRHIQKGRTHVAKMGPGFSYVRRLSDPRIGMSTVSTSHSSTVAQTGMATGDNPAPATGAVPDLSTVVGQTTTSIGSDLGTPSSSSIIHQALSRYGAVDDEVVRRLVRNCQHQAPDCTAAEIVHFIEEKGALVRVRDSRIYSPLGFLLTAVPKCFSGEAFGLYRDQCAKRREAAAAAEARRLAELEEWGREQARLLADPSVSEEDKQFIRECLGMR